MKFPDKTHLDPEFYLDGYIYKILEGYKTIDRNIFLKIVKLVENTIISKKNIFTCGNGGSSSIADHFVCDFVKGTSSDTNLKPQFFSLSSNMPILSAIANDINYSEIFSYQLEKYGSKNDLLILISSSGNSKNIISAIKKAKKLGIKTISLVGFKGGEAKKISDLSLHVNISNYGIVEDIHQSLMHIISQFIRYKNISKNKKVKF